LAFISKNRNGIANKKVLVMIGGMFAAEYKEVKILNGKRVLLKRILSNGIKSREED